MNRKLIIAALCLPAFISCTEEGNLFEPTPFLEVRQVTGTLQQLPGTLQQLPGTPLQLPETPLQLLGTPQQLPGTESRSPRVEVAQLQGGEESILYFDPEESEIVLEVISNRSWSLTGNKECEWISADRKEFLNLGGSTQSTLLRLKASPNPIREVRNTAIAISGEAGTRNFTLSQKRAKPTVSFAFEDRNRYLDPQYFSSLGGKRWGKITCNSSWTAEIDTDLTTAEGVSLETSSGEGNLDVFTVVVGKANLDFDNTKDIVVRFHMEDDTEGTISFKQQKGSILTFEFMGQDCNAKNWLFEGTNPGSSNKGQGSFFTPGKEYELSYSATTACYLYSSGMQCGSGASDYFELPAIEGKRLVRITDTDANGSTKPYICDRNMNPVKGGEYNSAFTKHVPFTWNLEETLPGERYRIVSGHTKTQRINTLELEYE